MDFQKTKKETIRQYRGLIKLWNKQKYKHENLKKEDNILLRKFLRENENPRFEENIKQLSINLQNAQNDRMKCVFVGNTSNGKSLLINAILGQKILPSSRGRTTSCFIRLTGTDAEEHLIKHNKAIININLNEVANELKKPKYSAMDVLDLHYPKTKCQLLQHDIEIIDCPGLSFLDNTDSWIAKNSNDCDLFVSVVNISVPIDKKERSFLINYANNIAIPKVIFAISQWDLVNLDEVEELKQQHEKAVSDFLQKPLKISSEELSRRIFFVSASNAFLTQGQDQNLNKEFERFQAQLFTNLNENGKQLKFDKHKKIIEQSLEKSMAYIYSLLNFSSVCNRFEKKIFLKNSCEYFYAVLQTVYGECTEIINVNAENYARKIMDIYKEKKSEFPENLMKFDEESLTKNFEEKFASKINLFEDGLREICLENTCIEIDHDQFLDYFNLYFNIEEIKQAFEKSILSQIALFIIEFDALSKNLKNYSESNSIKEWFSTFFRKLAALFGREKWKWSHYYNFVSDTCFDGEITEGTMEQFIKDRICEYFYVIFDFVLGEIMRYLINCLYQIMMKYKKDQDSVSSTIKEFTNFVNEGKLITDISEICERLDKKNKNQCTKNTGPSRKEQILKRVSECISDLIPSLIKNEIKKRIKNKNKSKRGLKDYKNVEEVLRLLLIEDEEVDAGQTNSDFISDLVPESNIN